MYRNLSQLVGILVVLLLTTSVVRAQDFTGGARIVPIHKLPSSTFDPRTDSASIYLEQAILFRKNGWFTQDKEVAVTARMTVNSIKKEDSTAQSLVISRVYKFDCSLYQGGRIEIPLRSLPLLETFRLSTDNYYVTSIVVELFLSKKRGETGFSRTLETIIAASSKIPVPGNPYAAYASVFGNTFSEVVNAAIKEGADTVPFAAFGIRFLQGPKAANLTAESGLLAIIIGSPVSGPGIIDITKPVGDSLSYDDADGLKQGATRVLNNHIVVRVVASTDPSAAQLARKETVERVGKEAKAAVTLAKTEHIETPNLKAFVRAQSVKGESFAPNGRPGSRTRDLSSIKPPKQTMVLYSGTGTSTIEGAIRELNKVRAFNPFQSR